MQSARRLMRLIGNQLIANMITWIFMNSIINTQNANHDKDIHLNIPEQYYSHTKYQPWQWASCLFFLCGPPLQVSCLSTYAIIILVCFSSILIICRLSFSKNIFHFLSKLNNLMANLLFLTLILNWLMEIKTVATTSKT